MTRRGFVSTASGILALLSAGYLGAVIPQEQASNVTAPVSAGRSVLDRYCVTCHNDRTNTAGLDLNSIDIGDVSGHTETLEKVVQRLRTRTMPPAGAPRPGEGAYDELVAHLAEALDRMASDHPNPGRTDTFRRLNRTEYQNAIRDLLALDVDASSLLPKDDASHGFDNVSAGGLSPTLLERYLAAAQKVSRLAIGSAAPSAGSHVVVLPVELTQEDHFDGLPLGSRGGTLVPYNFPQDGEYEVQVRLQRNRNENVEGLNEPHHIEIMLDGEFIESFTVTPSRNAMGGYYADEAVDQHLNVRFPARAGPRVLAVTFPRKTSALLETERQPYLARFNQDRHPRITPAIYTVSISGPFDAAGPGDTPSRRRIFTCHPKDGSEEADCARGIISTLARRAYRRPVTELDLQVPLAFYRDARSEEGFEAGIEMALRAILASTEFLFRIERDPRGVPPNTAYRISDIELASRLSFFLWSSIPDDELLDAAIAGRLGEQPTLERQVRRMLADPRAEALVTSFAGQWLYLRNLDAVTPDARLFPDFDDNLRQAFRRETELLFESILKEDRSVLDLLIADYTFLNERLAKHYGIPNVYGDRFRRVALEPDSERRGILGHGSILTVTSYATRTSPVFRGHWILENIFGMKAPPPPPNVPPLTDVSGGGRAASMRELMVRHRSDPACASCHQLMDPLGLALENFDAIGRWRTHDASGAPIDATGSFPGGSPAFESGAGLRQELLKRPELFVTTMTEKLLTYALGRGLEYYDAATLRAIEREARRSNHRFSSIVMGIVTSTPFQMRRSQ